MDKPSTFRCGDCGLVLGPDPFVAHVHTPLPTGRSFAPIDNRLYLDPDEEDIRQSTYNLQKPCPACGGHPGPPIHVLNQTTGIVRTMISCAAQTACSFEVGYNGYTREEARAGAIAQWNDRRPLAERRAERDRARNARTPV